MNPVVEAALVAVGGSVIIALASFLTTRSATRRTIAASADSAREARVWDKRAAAYVDAIAGIRHRQTIRENRAQSLRTDLLPPDLPEAPVSWPDVEARVLAYASPAVLRAFQASSDAGRRHSAASQQRAYMAEHGQEAAALRAQGAPGPAWTGMTPAEAAQAAKEALADATAKDDALIEAIRVELHGEAGRALSLLAPQGRPA